MPSAPSAPPRSYLRPIVTAGALFLALWFAYSIADLLLLLFLGFLFSVFLSALTDWFGRWLRLPRALGILASLLLTAVVLTAAGWLLIPQLTRQAGDLISALPQQMTQWEESITSFLQKYPLLRDLAGPIETGQTYLGHLMQDIGTSITNLFPYLFNGLWFVVHVVSLLAISIYFAANPALYRNGLVALFPPRQRPLALDVTREIADTLRAWMGGQLLAMLVLGALTWAGLALLGVPFPLAFGAFTGLAAIVPFFGTLFSTTLPALYVLPNHGIVYALAVAGLGAVIHLIEANVVQPLIFEERVELPPVWTLFSVLVMAKLLGVFGLLVAVPVLAVGRVLLRRIYLERILEPGGFEGPTGAAPILIRVPATEDIVVAGSRGIESVPEFLEESD